MEGEKYVSRDSGTGKAKGVEREARRRLQKEFAIFEANFHRRRGPVWQRRQNLPTFDREDLQKRSGGHSSGLNENQNLQLLN